MEYHGSWVNYKDTSKETRSARQILTLLSKLNEEILHMWNTSLWDYKLGEFRQFINTINPKSTLVADVLADCRELPCFPQKFRNMTAQELSADPSLIEELYNSRQGMQAEARYKL